MDPLSIAATATGLVKVSYEISKTLFNLADKTLNVEDHLNAFASEVSSVSGILKAVTSTLNDPRLRLSHIARGPTSNHDVWEALLGALNSLRLYFGKLKAKLDGIRATNGDGNLFKQAIQALELSLAREGVNNLRSNLLSHQQSLNTAFHMVQLYFQLNLPTSEQPDLRPQIARLIRLVEKLPQARDKNPSYHGREDLEDEELRADPKNVAQLRRAAFQVASAASTYAGSTTGSEYGAPLDAGRTHSIENWLSLAKVEEDSELDHLRAPEAPERLNLVPGDASSSSATVIAQEDSQSSWQHLLDAHTPSHYPVSPTGIPLAPMSSSIDLKSLKAPTVYTNQVPSASSLLDHNTTPLPQTLPTAMSDLQPPVRKFPKLFTQLHYIACFCLFVLLALSATEVYFMQSALRDLGAYPEDELLVATALISLGYVLTRVAVFVGRTRNAKPRYTRRIWWWHILPAIINL